MGMNRDDVEMLTGLMRKPMTQDDLEANTRESLKMLRNKYDLGNSKGFDDVFALTQRFVGRDPSIKALLKNTGLGTHPVVVERLAELALAARQRGEIK